MTFKNSRTIVLLTSMFLAFAHVALADDSELPLSMREEQARNAARAGAEASRSTSGGKLYVPGSGGSKEAGLRDDPDDEKIADTTCKDAAYAGKATCSTMSMVTDNPNDAVMLEMMTSQATGLMSAMQGSTGVAQTCQNQMDLQGLMGKITALKLSGCVAGIAKCTDSCKEIANDELRDIRLKEAQLKDLRDCSEQLARASSAAAGTGGFDPAVVISAKCKYPVSISSDGNLAEPVPISAANSEDIEKQREAFTNELERLKERNRIFGKKVAACQRYQQNAQAMLYQSMGLGQGYMQAKACVNAASSNPFGSIGSTNGAVDCTNPAIADVSPTCICQKDPNNPMCPTYKPNAGTVGGLAGPTSGVGGAGAGNPYVTDPLADPGSRLDGQIPKVQAAKGNNEIAGGNGGGLGGSGAMGRGGGDEGGGGGVRGGSDKSAIVGLAGGGGGGGAGGIAKTSGSGGVSGAVRGIMDKFNLKNFLPNRSDYKNRGIAGMSIPSADGITGPMGPSLFEKVSNQYQKQKTNLLDK